MAKLAVVVLFALVAMSLALSPPKTTKRRMEFCVQDQPSFMRGDLALLNASLDKIKSMGATCVRQMLYMHALHPCRGAEALKRLERYFALADGAKARGLDLQLVITSPATKWGAARVEGKECAQPLGLNPKPKELAKFIRKFVPLFTAKGVKRFSIWNEPNRASSLCVGKLVVSNTTGTNSSVVKSQCKGSSLKKQAVLYRRLYKAAWAKFQALKKNKRIPKGTQVLIGEIAGANNGAKFMNMVLKAGKGTLRAHGFASHPYQFCTKPTTRGFNFPASTCKRKMKGGIAWTKSFVSLASKWAKARRLVTPKGKRVPVFLTEFAYRKTGKFAVPESLRAEWYPLAMDVARKSGAAQMSIFQLYPSPAGKSWDTGLLNANGEPLPSFIALQNWAKKNGYIKA